MKNQPQLAQLLGAALEHHQRGALNQAEELYRQVLRAQPRNPDVLHYYGLLHHQRGDNKSALDQLKRALAVTKSNPALHFNLGVVLQAEGLLDQAAEHYRACIRLNPGFAMAYNNLGSVFEKQAAYDKADQWYQKALARDPQCVEALNNRGNVLKVKNCLTEAAQAYAAALRIRPDYAEAHNNLGTVFELQGEVEKARESYKSALRANPNYISAHSNLLFDLNYSTLEPAEVYVAHLAFGQRYKHMPFRFPERIKPKTRLRIGYVSPDFRRHSVAYFFEPILRHHDRAQFEIFCYANVARADETTERFKKMTDTWRDTFGMPDEQVAQSIADDEIDILVDLAGHTSGNRLPVFARKPAPIQVTYLGYPNTTGLPAMDYRLTDDRADPSSNDAWYVESLVRLPCGFLGFEAPTGTQVQPPPMLANGHVTFGSFNNLAKVSAETVRAWAAILARIPNSRLLMKCKSLCDESTRQAVARRFREAGVSDDRLDLVAYVPDAADHLDLYRRVDIALDTFPYNGTTTSCEAMWMGVPVVTRAGNAHASRVGFSLLTTLGLDDLAAESSEEYLEIAARLAGDARLLEDLRFGMRERMSNSPLMDGKGFTTELERAYKAMWERRVGTP